MENKWVDPENLTGKIYSKIDIYDILRIYSKPFIIINSKVVPPNLQQVKYILHYEILAKRKSVRRKLEEIKQTMKALKQSKLKLLPIPK